MTAGAGYFSKRLKGKAFRMTYEREGHLGRSRSVDGVDNSRGMGQLVRKELEMDVVSGQSFQIGPRQAGCAPRNGAKGFVAYFPNAGVEFARDDPNFELFVRRHGDGTEERELARRKSFNPLDCLTILSPKE